MTDRGISVIGSVLERIGVRKDSAAGSAGRDLVTAGIVLSAAIMFVGSGANVLHSLVDRLAGVGGGTNNTLQVALLLNIALILFGYRRYRDLHKEVEVRSAAEKRAQTLAPK